MHDDRVCTEVADFRCMAALLKNGRRQHFHDQVVCEERVRHLKLALKRNIQYRIEFNLRIQRLFFGSKYGTKKSYG